MPISPPHMLSVLYLNPDFADLDPDPSRPGGHTLYGLRNGSLSCNVGDGVAVRLGPGSLCIYFQRVPLLPSAADRVACCCCTTSGILKSLPVQAGERGMELHR